MLSDDWDNGLLWLAARNAELSGAIHEQVHLAAHAELRPMNSWLDREAGSRQHPARVVRLQVVCVGAVAVCLLANGVARAVANRRTVSCSM